MTTCLFIIDPQRDFMDERDSPMGIPGAVIDMMNLSDMIYECGDQIDRIVVSLDQHQHNHMAHSDMWVDSHHRNPKPFDRITYADVTAGKWRAVMESLEQTQAEYVRDVEQAGYGLTIWPKHCIIGSRGASICPRLSADLANWARPNRQVHFYNKSSNWSTEHFSAFKTAVPRYDDGTTWFNDYLYKTIQADTILIAGEALSHAVQETINDAIHFADNDLAKRMVILDDCTSPRHGCNIQAEQFLHEFCKLGGKIDRSDYLYRNNL